MNLADFKTADDNHVYDLTDDSPDGGVPLLKFPIIEHLGIAEHGFTTRAGGVSQGIFSTLNVSYTRGDDLAAVDENYKRIAVSMHADAADFVLSDQTHTTNIRKVTGDDRGKGILREKDYHDIDGLVTDEPGIVLSAFFADCVPIFIVDPLHHAAGLSHSGWRGTIHRMGRETIRVMQEAYGSRPKDLICAIGPSICQSCYEVSEDVAERFMEEFQGLGGQLCYLKSPGKYQLNLWKANEQVLLEAGILPEHMAVTNICTCCNARLLFSHRASHGRRGNLGAFIKLKEKQRGKDF